MQLDGSMSHTARRFATLFEAFGNGTNIVQKNFLTIFCGSHLNASEALCIFAQSEAANLSLCKAGRVARWQVLRCLLNPFCNFAQRKVELPQSLWRHLDPDFLVTCTK